MCLDIAHSDVACSFHRQITRKKKLRLIFITTHAFRAEREEKTHETAWRHLSKLIQVRW